MSKHDTGQLRREIDARNRALCEANERLTREIEQHLKSKAELARLAAIVESSHDAIIGKTLGGIVTSWNHGAELLYGYRAEEIVGQSIEAVVPPERIEELKQFLGMVGRGDAVEHFETARVRKDGTRVFVSLSISPIRDENGIVVGASSIARNILDISDRRKAENDIRRLNLELERRVAERTRELEEANQELEAFCYSVSHDLRAPLRHIDGYIQLIKEEARTSPPHELIRYFEVVADSARRMGKLIDDLLVFSRMGRQALETKWVDMKELANQSFSQLEGQTKGREVEWRIGELPGICGDKGMLRLVWDNLLDNALKYSRTRSRSVVEVAGRRTNGECVYSIHDNGVGFDMKYTGKLFGVFQRLHSAAEFEGTGIGLASVRRIVERHGGRVWAEGDKDQGATFSFALPA